MKKILLFFTILTTALNGSLQAQHLKGRLNFLKTIQSTFSKKNISYFIDPVKGNDGNKGISAVTAWKTFDRVNKLILTGGDQINIISSGIFNGSLVLVAKGEKNNPVKVNFAKGVYHFYRAGAYKKKFNISNTNDTPDSLKAVALYVRKSTFADIQGNGSKFIMHGKMIETCIDESRHISVSNLKFDYFRPTVSELRVVKSTDQFADLEISKDSRYSIKDSLLTWVGEGWSYQPISLWQILDPNTGDLQRINIQMEHVRYAEIENHRVRAVFPKNPGFKAGFIYQNRDITRDCAGIFLNRSSDVKLRKISIYYMHGMGIVSQLCHNVALDSLVVKPEAKSDRTCAAWADILHFSNCSGLISIKNCYLSAANDDAINIHGTFMRIIDQPKSNQLLVRFMHNQTYGFNIFDSGDHIDLIHGGNLLTYDQNTVISSKQLNDRDFLLTLSMPVNNSLLRKSDVVENVTRTPSVFIQGNTITRIPTRGILITTRRKVTIAGNTIKATHDSGIAIADDANSWYESGRVDNFTAENNLFINCGEPVINISPENIEKDPVIYLHKHINILKNKFDLKSKVALFAKSTAYINIERNKFRVSNQSLKESDLFDLRDCVGVIIKGNELK
jgi:hypothetical protein